MTIDIPVGEKLCSTSHLPFIGALRYSGRTSVGFSLEVINNAVFVPWSYTLYFPMSSEDLLLTDPSRLVSRKKKTDTTSSGFVTGDSFGLRLGNSATLDSGFPSTTEVIYAGMPSSETYSLAIIRRMLFLPISSYNVSFQKGNNIILPGGGSLLATGATSEEAHFAFRKSPTTYNRFCL